MKDLVRRDQVEHKNTIQQAIADLGPWFHNLHLPDGTQTSPNTYLGDFPAYKWNALAQHLPDNLEGWSVLDIGCNAGFYAFELAKRGAHVTGIDVDSHYLTQARWAAGQFRLEDKVEFKQMQIYDLASCEEEYDMVVFMGVFYHLRYPMLGLDIVSQKTRRMMVFQTAMMQGEDVYENTYDRGLYEREALSEQGWPKMAFIEHRFSGDPTNWWLPNHAGVEAMLRSSGMRVIKRAEDELYICEPDVSNPSCVSTWNAAEILSATGRPWRSSGQISSSSEKLPAS